MTWKLTSHFSGKDGIRFGQLYDPVQTHAIYGVTKDTKSYWKLTLKSIGAKKFREVKANSKHFVILCFDASDITI